MTFKRIAYGHTENGFHCVNAEPSTYGHECSRPAEWIGTNKTGFNACYCGECKDHGYEARKVVSWETISK